jgi:aconitate hydratase
MINGIGVMGWGVGGIEAEAVMLGQPYYMSIPRGGRRQAQRQLERRGHRHRPGAHHHRTAAHTGVVEKFVEFFGQGSKPVPHRPGHHSNMSPEYGATMGIFPVDEKTLDYLE